MENIYYILTEGRMIAMKNSKDILNNAIEEVSEKELMEVAGGKRGTGWFATITDDCPNSVFVCC